MNRTIFYLFTCILLLAQCTPEEQKVTAAEAVKFADDMEAVAVKHRQDLVTSHIILQALTDRIMKDNNASKIGDIKTGLEKGIKNAELDRNIYAILGKHGTFEKVKVYEKNGVQRVIFRAYGDEGFNYLDMELTKLNDKVGIADILLYTSGETISKSLGDFVVKLVDGKNNKNTFDALETMQSVKRLMQKGNYQQAKREFDRLPSYVKNTKLADVQAVQIASNLDEETYMKEIERFERKYAGEAYIQLTMIDLYFLRKDYDKALSAINQIDSLINKDTFLDYYRGLLYNVKGNSDKAMECYKKVTENNPQFPGAYAELMAHYIEKQDEQNAIAYFTKYKNLRNSDEEVINTYETAYPFLKE